MLKDEDVRIDFGLAQHGGDFMRMEHIPTGIERWHAGPLKGVHRQALQQRWLSEIEAELLARGLVQHVVPVLPRKSKSQGRRRRRRS